MKAIIIATKGVDGAEVLSERLGAAMLPLLDRPFLQHVVECLVRWGITEIDVVLSHLPEKVEAFLEAGSAGDAGSIIIWCGTRSAPIDPWQTP